MIEIITAYLATGFILLYFNTDRIAETYWTHHQERPAFMSPWAGHTILVVVILVTYLVLWPMAFRHLRR